LSSLKVPDRLLACSVPKNTNQSCRYTDRNGARERKGASDRKRDRENLGPEKRGTGMSYVEIAASKLEFCQILYSTVPVGNPTYV
jgi:hypothetical protein